MKEKLLISFSGGRTSAYMTWWLHENISHKYEMIVVFANTGKEREQTLEFVKQCDEYFGWDVVWVECVTNPERRKGVSARVVTFETASRNGEPFEEMIAKYGIPNINFSHCSRQLKAHAIRAYAKEIGWRKYKTAIGIRFDEQSRIDLKRASKERLIYPLATMQRVTTSDINLFWSKQPFDLKLKSYEGNCDLCWKKSLRKQLTIIKEDPSVTIWWHEMETKYGTFVPEGRTAGCKTPIHFFRTDLSAQDLLKMSQESFEPAFDTSKEWDFYKQLEIFDATLDENGSCSESCEAF